jgi:hypothetical protein
MMAIRRYEIVLRRHETQQLTLDELATRADMHPGLVQRFVELGLIEPIGSDGVRSVFDASAVPAIAHDRKAARIFGDQRRRGSSDHGFARSILCPAARQ